MRDISSIIKERSIFIVCFHVCRGVRYPSHTCVNLELDYDWIPNYFLSQNHLVCHELAFQVGMDEHSTFSR